FPQEHTTVIHNGFLNAEDYVHISERRQRDYVIGIIDGMMLAPLFGAPGDGPIKPLLDCVTGMSDSQIAAIIAKFLREHPERWNESLHGVVYSAMTQSCAQK